MMEEDGNGLRRIRNLGSHSEAEIKETVKKLQAEYDLHPRASAPFVKLVKPSRKTMSQQIDTFHLSRQALNALHASGIFYVQDLYHDHIVKEPGWFAVRELFDMILDR